MRLNAKSLQFLANLLAVEVWFDGPLPARLRNALAMRDLTGVKENTRVQVPNQLRTFGYLSDAPKSHLAERGFRTFVTDEGTFVVDVCIKKSGGEIRRSEDYQVTNRKTPMQSGAPEDKNRRPDDVPAVAGLDKKGILKKKLHEITAIRDDMVKQLSEKPFMEISQRQRMKKGIPLLDAQIRRLRLDISTLEMLSNISSDDLANPKLVQHYQHYDAGKRKP